MGVKGVASALGLTAIAIVAGGCETMMVQSSTWEDDGKPKPDLWCYDFSDYDYGPTPILYLYWRGENAGDIMLANGTEINADYKLEGTDHRWNWGADFQGSYQYAITVGPDNTGHYFDFSLADENGRATSKDLYRCKAL